MEMTTTKTNKNHDSKIAINTVTITCPLTASSLYDNITSAWSVIQ